MLQEKILTIFQAVRLRYASLVVLLLVAVYWFGIHPLMTNWGSTLAERQMALFGDELIPEGSAIKTKAITINAPKEVVWQWLVQIGQDRAGFYTYTWLENLVGADIHNTNEIRPEWQAVGEGWRLLPADYLGGVSAFSGLSKMTTDSSAPLSSIKGYPKVQDLSYQLPRSWQQINDDGFGDKNNVGSRAMTEFAGYLCVGVTNFNLSSREMNGCELWCYNRTGWIQSVGNRSSASIGPGFGNKNNAECSILIEFKHMLYAGTANNRNGCELWRTKNPVTRPWEKIINKVFGYHSNFAILSAKIFMGFLYIGTMNSPKGCQIWKTSDGNDFEAVAGGRSHTPSGFGESMNIYAWYMKEYNGKLLVGTQNIFGGEIWRSPDGTNWECLVGLKGNYPRSFQIDDLNWGIRTLTVFKGDLYAGTAAIPPITVTS